MTITFTCPHCGKNLQVAEDRMGESGPCAECGAPVSVPDPNNRFAGAAQGDRLRFKPRPWEMLFGLGFIMMVLALVVMIMSRSTGGPSHMSACMNNMKELFQAVQIYEARQNRYPLASTQPFTGRPESYKSPHPAGYSWQVPILPHLGYMELLDRWQQDSQDFNLSPFDPANNQDHPSVVIPAMICPASPIERVDLNQSAYQVLATSDGLIAPARSSYVAFSASHVTNASGPGQLYEADPQSPLDGNGLFPFPKTAASANDGFSSSEVADGLSHTLALCDTLEPAYAAWCDGQATWTIGAWPGSRTVPTVNGAADGLLGWPDTDQTSLTSIASGSDLDPAEMYLPASRYYAQYDRRWGPSSLHGNGTVTHMFADGHAQRIRTDIDRNLYLRLISRDGIEVFDLADIE